MNTGQPTSKPYKPTAGVEALLEALELKVVTESWYSLKSLRTDLEKHEKDLAEQKKIYEWKVAAVAEAKDKIRLKLKDIAGIIVDLGRLGCPEELIKKKFEDYSGHEVAVWLES